MISTLRPTGAAYAANVAGTSGTAPPAPLAPARVPVRVVSREVLSPRIVAITFERTDGEDFHTWGAGAHVDVHLSESLTRQYSLCPTGDPALLKISVLRERESRGGSQLVHESLNVGDELTVSDPRNNFPLLQSRKYLFIAGGIGITPMLSMIEQAEREGRDWNLYYLASNSQDLAYAQELRELYGTERVTLHASSVAGRLDLRTIFALPRAHMLVYACGPEPLINEVKDYCLGWPPGVLHTELFTNDLLGAGTSTDPFEIELKRTNTTVTVGEGETVLEKLEEQGIRVLSSCRVGLCGTCEVGVLKGDVEHRDAVLDDDAKDAGDIMLVCVSRAAADCSKLVLDI